MGMLGRGPLGLKEVELSFGQKLKNLNWLLLLLVCLTASTGFAVLYSAADGSFNPWASRQMVRFAMGMGLMFVIAMVDIRVWLKMSYLIYFVALVLLLAVEVMGHVGMGAQRWVNLGFIRLQPSELMKVALVMTLARYFHSIPPEEVTRYRHLVVPAAIVLLPSVLVLRQPDLGTTLLMLAGSAAMLFMAGVRLWIFIAAGISALAAIPLAWNFLLHTYQKKRVLTFLNPEQDPLGAGYHIMQSKIALGSGGLFGKGFMNGSQSHLNFLPEKQTDFIFTMLAEEFGLVGGATLVGLYALIIFYGALIAYRSRNTFCRLLSMGITTTLFLYVFINIAMVMGLLPVVGVPLPLLSYGGSVMMTIMAGIGLLMSVSIHRDVQLPRRLQDDF